LLDILWHAKNFVLETQNTSKWKDRPSHVLADITQNLFISENSTSQNGTIVDFKKWSDVLCTKMDSMPISDMLIVLETLATYMDKKKLSQVIGRLSFRYLNNSTTLKAMATDDLSRLLRILMTLPKDTNIPISLISTIKDNVCDRIMNSNGNINEIDEAEIEQLRQCLGYFGLQKDKENLIYAQKCFLERNPNLIPHWERFYDHTKIKQGDEQIVEANIWEPTQEKT